MPLPLVAVACLGWFLLGALPSIVRAWRSWRAEARLRRVLGAALTDVRRETLDPFMLSVRPELPVETYSHPDAERHLRGQWTRGGTA